MRAPTAGGLLDPWSHVVGVLCRATHQNVDFQRVDRAGTDSSDHAAQPVPGETELDRLSAFFGWPVMTVHVALADISGCSSRRKRIGSVNVGHAAEDEVHGAAVHQVWRRRTGAFRLTLPQRCTAATMTLHHLLPGAAVDCRRHRRAHQRDRARTKNATVRCRFAPACRLYLPSLVCSGASAPDAYMMLRGSRRAGAPSRSGMEMAAPAPPAGVSGPPSPCCLLFASISSCPASSGLQVELAADQALPKAPAQAPSCPVRLPRGQPPLCRHAQPRTLKPCPFGSNQGDQ